jgi:hypothetical protein
MATPAATQTFWTRGDIRNGRRPTLIDSPTSTSASTQPSSPAPPSSGQGPPPAVDTCSSRTATM